MGTRRHKRTRKLSFGRAARIELGAGAAALVYGAVLDRVIPRRLHVPVNFAAGAAALAVCLRAGIDAEAIGIEPRRIGRGIAIGALCAGAIAAAVAGAAAHPRTRGFFIDREAVEASPGTARFEVLVRIPFGTALPEELLFRGALLGLLLRRPPHHAVAISSALFGLWHVAPTLRKLEESHVTGWATASGTAARAGTVAGVVGVTTAAGVAFSWLRLRSRSLAAPWIAHSAVNALSYAAARRAGRA